MARLTPTQFADKQATRLKGAAQEIRAGIEAVTEAPTRKAAMKKEKFRQNLNAAIDSGRWERNLNAVTVEDWKDAMLNKGVGRISAGIDGARGKVIAFAEKLLPFQDSLRKDVEKMPDLTLEDRINRATQFMRGMSKFKK